MSEWKEYKLGDLAEITSSKRIFYSEYVKTGVPFYRSKEIIDKYNNREIKTELFISDTKYLDIKNKFGVPRKDDILLTSVGTLGIPYLVNQKDYFYFKDGNLTWFKNIDNNRILPKYLFIWLHSNLGHEKLNEITIGSTQPALTISGLKTVEILSPSINEQRAIVSILDSLESKIDLLRYQNNTLEQVSATLFHQWFMQEIDENWEETSLGYHTEVFRGLSYKGSGLSQDNSDLPMHNLNSVYEGGGYKYDGIKYYNGDYKERHLLNSGDIIVTNTEQGHELRLIGFPAIVPDYFGKKGLFSQHIYRLLILNNSYLSKEFIYYLLMSSSVREQIVAATNGSTVNMLAIDGLTRPTFRLPPKEKVKRFTDIVHQYWEKNNNNHYQIRTLTQLRDTLLPKLMKGELKVLQ